MIYYDDDKWWQVEMIGWEIEKIKFPSYTYETKIPEEEDIIFYILGFKYSIPIRSGSLIDLIEGKLVLNIVGCFLNLTFDDENNLLNRVAERKETHMFYMTIIKRDMKYRYPS